MVKNYIIKKVVLLLIFSFCQTVSPQKKVNIKGNWYLDEINSSFRVGNPIFKNIKFSPKKTLDSEFLKKIKKGIKPGKLTFEERDVNFVIEEKIIASFIPFKLIDLYKEDNLGDIPFSILSQGTFKAKIGKNLLKYLDKKGEYLLVKIFSTNKLILTIDGDQHPLILDFKKNSNGHINLTDEAFLVLTQQNPDDLSQKPFKVNNGGVDWNLYGLYGKPKKVINTIFHGKKSAPGVYIAEGEPVIEKIEFNKEGRIISRFYFPGSYHKLYSTRSKYQYSNNEQLIITEPLKINLKKGIDTVSCINDKSLKKCFQVTKNIRKLKSVTKLRNGRSINLKTYRKDNVFFEIDYKYDNKGFHPKVVNETMNNGKPVSLKKEELHYLEFDQHKNWTKKLVKDFTNENWIKETVHIREIEYY